MYRVVIFLTLLFVCCSLKADTYTYLVYMAMLPNATDNIDLPKGNKQAGFENMIDKGHSSNSQPFRITRVIDAPNPDYKLIVITPKNDNEKGWFNMAESKGYIQKISVERISNRYDHRIGGWVQEYEKEVFNQLPENFNYVVTESTP